MMTGDLRSGAQLLRDAQMDSRQTIESIACNPRGRALLAQLAWYIECRATAATAVLGRPVERPLVFNQSSVLFARENPAISGRGLAMMCNLWIFNHGFDQRRFGRVLGSLPPDMIAALERMLANVQGRSPAARGNALGLVPSDCAGTLPESADSKACYNLFEEAVLEEEKELGISKIEFDPTTQLRKRFVINSRFATIWGQHKEECLMRFSAHEGDVRQTDLCGLCNFLMICKGALECNQTFYHRFCFGAGKDVRVMLVRTEMLKSFSSLGLPVQVRSLRRMHFSV
jgi:hypothetical protein